MINFEELSNAIFKPLKNWGEASAGNWNILIMSGFLLLIVGGILIFVFRNKIGKADERTNPIYLRSSLLILCVIVLCDVIFPKEYMWQIFFLFKYSLAFIVSGIYLGIRYKRDFLS